MGFVRPLLLALAFFVGLGCTTAQPLTPRAPTAGATHFTIETFNIHRGMSGDARTVEAVGAPDADILCLQEVTAAWEKTLRTRYGQQYPYMLFAPKENAGGLGVLSHYPLEDHGIVLVPGDLHPGWIVDVVTPGERVQLVLVHLRSLFNGTRDWITNYFNSGRDHVAETRLFLARTRPEMPTIVIGDFNESLDGDAITLLEGRGFTSVLPMFAPGQPTWKGKTIGAAMTIDHILVDSSFEPLNAWTANPGASDHIPVIAHVELRARD